MPFGNGFGGFAGREAEPLPMPTSDYGTAGPEPVLEGGAMVCGVE